MTLPPKNSPITWKKGTLTRWNEERGFGFIKPAKATENDIFVHISGFRAGMERRPVSGDTVYYQITRDETNGKRRACNAHISGVQDNALKPPPRAAKTQPIEELLAQLFILIPLLGSLYLLWQTTNPLPLLVYSVMSVITIVLYNEDKQRAQRKAWRISESSLHLVEFLGGWPGALIAQYSLRHKNAKFAYQVTFWVIVCLHQTGWIFFILGNPLPMTTIRPNKMWSAESSVKKVQGEPGPLRITKIAVDAPGRDNENPNGEWIEIFNQSNAVVSMYGYRLHDEANNSYFFSNFSLSAGSTVRLYSGQGNDNGSSLYWGRTDHSVWNNEGDTAFLRNVQGEVIASYHY